MRIVEAGVVDCLSVLVGSGKTRVCAEINMLQTEIYVLSKFKFSRCNNYALHYMIYRNYLFSQTVKTVQCKLIIEVISCPCTLTSTPFVLINNAWLSRIITKALFLQ